MKFSLSKNKTGVFNQESVTNIALYLIEDILNPALITLSASIGASKLQSIRKLDNIFIKKHANTRNWFAFPSVGDSILEKQHGSDFCSQVFGTKL